MKKLQAYLAHQILWIGEYVRQNRPRLGRDKTFEYLNHNYDELSGTITGALVVEALTEEEADQLQDWLDDEIDDLFDAAA